MPERISRIADTIQAGAEEGTLKILDLQNACDALRSIARELGAPPPANVTALDTARRAREGRG